MSLIFSCYDILIGKRRRPCLSGGIRSFLKNSVFKIISPRVKPGGGVGRVLPAQAAGRFVVPDIRMTPIRSAEWPVRDINSYTYF